MPTSSTNAAASSATTSVKNTDTNAYLNSSANTLQSGNTGSDGNNVASISQDIQGSYKDIRDFLNNKLIPIFERPLYALLEMFDKIADILLKIFSNYDELENTCDVMPDLLTELREQRESDKNLLKKQLSNVMIIPITVYIMYNWLFLSCFRERYIINENLDNNLYWFIYGKSLEEKNKAKKEMRALKRQSESESKRRERAGETEEEYEDEEEGAPEAAPPEDEAAPPEGEPPVVEGQASVIEGEPTVVQGEPTVVQGEPTVIQGGQEQGEESLIRQQEMSHMKGGGLKNLSYALPKRMKYGGMPEMSMADQAHMASDMASSIGSNMGSLEDMKNISTDDITKGLAKMGSPGGEEEEEEEVIDKVMNGNMDQINQAVPGASNIKDTLMRWYTPILHIFAGASLFDKAIFGMIWLICQYLISPNLHPLLFYTLFFIFLFRYIKKHNDEFVKSITNWLDYVTSKEGSGVVLTVHPFIKQWTTLFVVLSFAGSIPKGINDFREYQMTYLFIFLSILFIIIFSVIMAKFLDTACMLVIGYFIVYSYFGMMFFSKTGVFKTMYGMDVYFFKRIRDLSNPKDKVLNILINGAFLFIFEIIIILFLIHGIQQYLSNAEDMTIKVAMSLINGLLIYMVLKYCHYKFENLLPRYMKDIKPGAYEDLMDNCFDGEIPIKSYASDINKDTGRDEMNTFDKMKDTLYRYSGLKNAQENLTTVKSDFKKGVRSAKEEYLGHDYSTNLENLQNMEQANEEIQDDMDDIKSKIDEYNKIPAQPEAQPEATPPTTTA